jgi:L-fucose isomerase-like protein
MPIAAVKLGLAPIGKFVFSQQDARRYADLTAKHLRALGVDFVDLEGVTGDGLLFRHEDLPAVIRHLREQRVDALFCPHCNFGTEDVAALLGKEMGLPYLLWGPRDEAPLPDGTRLRDTQCGLFATSQVLQRLGVPFTYLPNCRLEDPVFSRGVLGFLRVAAAVRAWRSMKIAQVGQRLDFFWTVMVNEAEMLERFGTQVWQVYDEEVMDRVAALVQTPSAELRALLGRVASEVAFRSLDEQQIAAIAALKLVLADLAEREGLSAIALQCFPGLQKRFGIYPCYANSLLTMEGVPVICETDVHGAMTSVLLEAAALGETPPFFADLTIRHPENDNAELLWHCGSFPVSLADEGAKPVIGEHFIMPENAAGVGHWRIKGGDLTVARLGAMRGEYSLAFGEGRGTGGPETVGTYVWLEVDDWLRWERKFIRGPYIHHVAGIHGRLAPILWEACRYLPGVKADPVDKEEGELEDWWWR